MAINPKQIILKILDIIGYEADREVFADGFLEVCRKRAFLELMLELPAEKKRELENSVADDLDPDKIGEELVKLVPDEARQRKFKDVSLAVFADYLSHVMPVLKQDQNARLIRYLESLTVVYGRIDY